jgi:hypothetical protein
MADPLTWFKRKFTKVSPKELAKRDSFYANDMGHYSDKGFIDGLLRKYFSRGDLIQSGTFQFWAGPGVDRRSVTLGYSEETGEYATRPDQVLFYGNLPALVFDMEARREEEGRLKPKFPFAFSRKPKLHRRRAKPQVDEWASRGYPTILADTEGYSIQPITSMFGTQHHRFGYTIGARFMRPWFVLPSYLLVFMDAFKKGGELFDEVHPRMGAYIEQILENLKGAVVIVVAKGYTAPKDRKVLGLFYAESDVEAEDDDE